MIAANVVDDKIMYQVDDKVRRQLLIDRIVGRLYRQTKDITK